MISNQKKSVMENTHVTTPTKTKHPKTKGHGKGGEDGAVTHLPGTRIRKTGNRRGKKLN